jgi:hypothetical protein
MIMEETYPSDFKGLGKYYEYQLYDKPFLGKKKKKGTRYCVPLTNSKGEKKYITGKTAQEVIDKFKVEHPAGWNETTAGVDDMKKKLKEKQNSITTWVVDDVKDMGDLPLTAYPVAKTTTDTKTYVPPGSPETGSEDWLTGIITMLRSWGIK